METIKSCQIRSLEARQGIWVARAARTLEANPKDYESWMRMHRALRDLRISEFQSYMIGRKSTWRSEPLIVESIAKTAFNFGWEGMNSIDEGKIENAIVYTGRSAMLFFHLDDFASAKDQLAMVKLLADDYMATKPQGYDHGFALSVNKEVEKYSGLIEIFEPMKAQEKLSAHRASYHINVTGEVSHCAIVMATAYQC